MPKKFKIINIFLIATFFFTSVALAQDHRPGNLTLTGTVGGTGEGFIQFIIDTGETFHTYKVYPIDPQVLDDLRVGDIIEISGYFNGDDLMVASDIQTLTREPDSLPQTADIYVQDSASCSLNGSPHPIAAGIAETYAAEYETIIEWICEREYSFGEVMLALQTAEMVNGDPELLLEEKSEGGGWGKVWVSHGLITSEQLASAPVHPSRSNQSQAEAKKRSKDQPEIPDHAQTPGKPGDDFIPPGQDKDKKDKELPENAGPPQGDGPPGQLKDKDKDKDNIDKDK